MNPKYHVHEQIDRYLKQDLSEEELAQFNKNLLNDEEFKIVLEAQQEAHGLIVDNEMIKLKERMSKDLNNDGGNSFNWNKIILLSVTASFLGVFCYVQFSKPTPSVVQKSTIKDQKEISSKPVEEEDIVENNNTTAKVSPLNEKALTTDNKQIVVAENSSTNEKNSSTETKTVNTISVVPENTSKSIEPKKIIPETKILVNKEKIVSTPEIKEDNSSNKTIETTPEIDDAFTPSMGETWSFPIQSGDDGTINIINKAGLTVYSAAINGGLPNEWNGRDLNGNEVNAGSYYFIVNFTNNKLLKGHITIIK